MVEEHDPDLEAGWPLVKEEPGLQGVLQTSELCYKLAGPFEKGTLLVDFYHTSLGGHTEFPSHLSVGLRFPSGAFLVLDGIMCSLDTSVIPEWRFCLLSQGLMP